MEPNGVSNSRDHRSPSSVRFLSVFSQKEDGGSSSIVGDELNEDDVFWTGDFAESDRKSLSPFGGGDKNNHRFGFRQPENFGILAALPGNERKLSHREGSVLFRNPLISSSPPPSSTMIPTIPKPTQKSLVREFSQSMPVRNFGQSAPMNVPVRSKVMSAKNRELVDVDDGYGDGEEEMLPPHEIVARDSGGSRKTTFSVLEGVGRTLKGRDLRQVRNAVWRQTGFLD